MKELFDKISLDTSEMVTKAYSTSFSLGIRCLAQRLHSPIYAIYGFVRFADEIVDTFHDYDKARLLAEFKADTYQAIADGISLNPILNSFQWVVNKYQIDRQLIDTFLHSMEMDLHERTYDEASYKEYILGSAEVVGLMCLKVFVEGDIEKYETLKPHAMSLGAAFQKINFLRDVHADYVGMGRVYFPNVQIERLDAKTKRDIELDIDNDFRHGHAGILMLPHEARFGVYIAYIYYYQLFRKIRSAPPSRILHERIRISNRRKAFILATSYVRHSISWM